MVKGESMGKKILKTTLITFGVLCVAVSLVMLILFFTMPAFEPEYEDKYDYRAIYALGGAKNLTAQVNLDDFIRLSELDVYPSFSETNSELGYRRYYIDHEKRFYKSIDNYVLRRCRSRRG